MELPRLLERESPPCDSRSRASILERVLTTNKKLRERDPAPWKMENGSLTSAPLGSKLALETRSSKISPNADPPRTRARVTPGCKFAQSVRGIRRIDFPRAAASIMDNQRMKSLIRAASATTHNKWRLHPLFLLSAIIGACYLSVPLNPRCRNARARARAFG